MSVRQLSPVLVILAVTRLSRRESNMANRTNQKVHSIKHFFRFFTVFPIVYFFVLMVSMTALSYAFADTRNYVLLWVIIGVGTLLVGIYVWFLVYITSRLNIVFIDGLYNTTIQNFDTISRNQNRFFEYPNKGYSEIANLNNRVENLKRELVGATLIPTTVGFDDIDLDYWDKEKHLVKHESFLKELPNIIFKSQNYRNMLIEIYYDLTEEDLTVKDVDYVVGVLRNNFRNYSNYLFILPEDRKAIWLYLPRVDSLSKIKEQIEICIKECSIARRLAEGITPLNAHFSVVCYPYSDVHEMVSDLRYARRQNLDIYFYLPNRLASIKNNAIARNSQNLNQMTKMLMPLLNMDMGLEFAKANDKTVESVLKTVSTYFAIEYAGIVGYDDSKNHFRVVYRATDGKETLTDKNGFVEKEFIETMDRTRDDDNSHYFSCRDHANSALGRHLDRIGIESGFFYVVRENDAPIGVIYFFNKEKSFVMDSYVQESLIVLCNKIASFILSKRRDLEVESSYNEIDALLKLSDFSTYRVNLEDYTLLRASSTMKNLFPQLKIGEKCYKALYGLDAPCADCPLKTGLKKSMHIGKDNFETSLVLSEHNNNNYQVMAVKNLYTHKSHHRYNQDMVINSFHSLVENLNDLYEVAGKGYLLLLRVDNVDELVETHGSEGFLSIMRDFTKRLKKLHNGYENIYYYTNQFLALLYPEFGQTDILDECEKIYRIAQNLDGSVDYTLKLTYLPVSYPRVYPNAASLIKQADSFAMRGRYATHKDYIYFDESNYTRSADREQFLLAVIQKAFSDKTFEVNLQPMVNANDKQIWGAELLLRITDEYRNTAFRTDELVNVAAKYNQIGIISHALLDYIGSLYREYGASFFSSLGFKRMALNTDYSFFTDKNFRKDTKKFIDDLKLPKHFLAFEIPESDAASHIDEFREIAKMTKELNIVLVCDQYTGRHISVEILKDIGFNEIKVSRNVVLHIDSDNNRYANLKQLLYLIRNMGMKASVVGVENIDQYLLIKQVDESVSQQGFYLYRPLEKQALIEALRGANRRHNEDEEK